MTVLTFPSNPTLGQIYDAPTGVRYVYDGVKWIVETTTSTSEAVTNLTQDRVAPMFVDGDNTGITFTYNAGTNTMSASVTAVNGDQLVNGVHEFTLGDDGNLTLPTQGNLLLTGGLIGPVELGVGVGIFGADPTVSTTGGNIILQGGANYLESGGPTTTGGEITISAGQGSNDVDASHGGDVNITSGPASRYAGDIRIEGGGTYGSSGEGGDITIQSGSSISGVAGDITIQSGVGAGGGYTFEGLLKLRGKDAEIASADGSFSIKTGDLDSISNPPLVWEFGTTGDLILPAGGDILDSNGVSVLGGSSIVEREVNFPYGEEGDEPGVLAATPNGALYYSVGTYLDISTYNDTYTGLETNQSFSVGQTGGLSNSVTFEVSEDSSIGFIIANGGDYFGYWSVEMVDEDFGGVFECTDFSASFDAEVYTVTLFWPHRTGVDPTSIAEAARFSATFNGANSLNRPAVWRQLDNGNFNFDGNLIAVDGTLEITATTDIRLDANDDLRLRAVNDVTVGSESGFVEITTNNDSENETTWKFDDAGAITFPDATVQTTAFTGFPDLVVAEGTAPETGILWFNTEEARMYIKYNEQWVDASPTVLTPPVTELDINSVTFNDATVQTTAWTGTVSYRNITEVPEPFTMPTFVGGGGASTWLTAD